MLDAIDIALRHDDSVLAGEDEDGTKSSLEER